MDQTVEQHQEAIASALQADSTEQHAGKVASDGCCNEALVPPTFNSL